MNDSVQIIMGQDQQVEDGLDDQINALKQIGINATNVEEFYSVLNKYFKLRNKIQNALISNEEFCILEKQHQSNEKRKNGIKSILKSLTEVKTELDTIIDALGGKIAQRLRDNYNKTKNLHFDYHMGNIDELNYLGSELIMYESTPSFIERLRTSKQRKEIKKKMGIIEGKEQLLLDNFKKVEAEFNTRFNEIIGCIRTTVSGNLFQFLAVYDETIQTFDDFIKKAREFYETGNGSTFTGYYAFIKEQITRKQKDLGEFLKEINSTEQQYHIQSDLRTNPSTQLEKTNLTEVEKEEYKRIVEQFPDIEYIKLSDISIIMLHPNIIKAIKTPAKVKKKVPGER